MPKSNLFRGRTIKTAMSDAVHKRAKAPEQKDQRRCNDLILEISRLQNILGRLGDEIDRSADDIERLQQEAAGELTVAVLAALGGAAGTFRAFARAARILRRKPLKSLTTSDVLEVLALIGPGLAIYKTLQSINKFAEARRIAQDLKRSERASERLLTELLSKVEMYDRVGCGLSNQPRERSLLV